MTINFLSSFQSSDHDNFLSSFQSSVHDNTRHTSCHRHGGFRHRLSSDMAGMPPLGIELIMYHTAVMSAWTRCSHYCPTRQSHMLGQGTTASCLARVQLWDPPNVSFICENLDFSKAPPSPGGVNVRRGPRLAVLNLGIRVFDDPVAQAALFNLGVHLWRSIPCCFNLGVCL